MDEVAGEKKGENKRKTGEEKATREVTSAVNNLSFKNQCEALIGAVANPETHIHTPWGASQQLCCS